jgi:hypothetical protein
MPEWSLYHVIFVDKRDYWLSLVSCFWDQKWQEESRGMNEESSDQVARTSNCLLGKLDMKLLPF